ncbi:nitroreductase family protein [Stratiformator vulcanicus]|uniref:Malonic semialdehyde reductase n=1 Tax=Stratiformator vulcanicus TaxID=2527980 RepID=A0A517QXW6_9PLAN|nr:nitroreductase family protein [Stratiformator vulcanicus]QDT36420.1 malonic semialdehyde reductase [Stratiformator vulcanicus]
MAELPDPLELRTADHPIEALLLKRWSPRAMDGGVVTDEHLASLFEAARWAPSTYNEQEWRFLYARRDSEHWKTFFGLLMEANQAWCDNASDLIVLLSKKTFAKNGKPNPVHTLDAGAAMQNLLLQAASMNLVAHAMAGFDRGKARAQLSIPDDYEVEAMIAIGRPGDPDDLPTELQEREEPSGRNPIGDFVLAGPFAFDT